MQKSFLLPTKIAAWITVHYSSIVLESDFIEGTSMRIRKGMPLAKQNVRAISDFLCHGSGLKTLFMIIKYSVLRKYLSFIDLRLSSHYNDVLRIT